MNNKKETFGYKAEIYHESQFISMCTYHKSMDIDDNWDSIKQDLLDVFNPDSVSKIFIHRTDGEKRWFDMTIGEYYK